MGKSFKERGDGPKVHRLKNNEDEEDFDWKDTLHRLEVDEEVESKREQSLTDKDNDYFEAE